MRVREIPGPAGALEALLDEPPPVGGVNAEGLVERGVSDGLRAAVVLAHPHPQYGGTMHTKVVFQAAKAFKRIGCAVLRFNFRGTGRSAGTYDDGRGEMDDFRAGIDFMRHAVVVTLHASLEAVIVTGVARILDLLEADDAAALARTLSTAAEIEPQRHVAHIAKVLRRIAAACAGHGAAEAM